MPEGLSENEDHGGNVDPQRMKLLGRALIVGGILVYLLALVGEVLGWWNDLGVLLSGGGLVGSLAGLAVSAWAAMNVKGGHLLDKQDQALNKQDQMLSMQDQMLGKQDQMLGKQDQMLGKQDQMLGKQDLTNERLEKVLTVSSRTLEWQDDTTRSLDRIQRALDDRSTDG